MSFCHREGEVLSFFEVIIRGRTKKEIVIGLKDKRQDQPTINPKDKVSRIHSFGNVEAFIVLAEDMEDIE